MTFDFPEFFGVDASDVFDEKQAAEGYLAGSGYADKIHELIIKDFATQSRIFKENLLAALRDNL